MADFRLDADGDQDFTAGRAHMVYDAEYVGQRLQIAMKHVMGEWFRDENEGTDYLGAIWGKSSDLSRRAEFRRRALQVPSIVEVQKMDLNIDRATRALTGSITVLRDDGTELEVRFPGRD